MNRKIVTSWARNDDLDQSAPKNVSRLTLSSKLGPDRTASCPIINFGYIFVAGKVPFLNDRLPLRRWTAVVCHVRTKVEIPSTSTVFA